MPLAWVATKSNLGAALRALGERKNGTARLEEAVTAYRSPLEERTRERMPLHWEKAEADLRIVINLIADRHAGSE